jgi:tRNA threonylcarbamoyladenosine biosynthesis protein TsaE
VKITIVTGSAAATRQLALALGQIAAPGWVVLLDGPLGAGKTVFAQGLIAGLGYGGRVASPTFTLINEYDARLHVWHADLYRLDQATDFAAIGGEDILHSPPGLAIVEWATKLGDSDLGCAMHVEMSFVGAAAPDDRRRLVFCFGGQRYAAARHLLEQWPVDHGADPPDQAKPEDGAHA